MAFLTITSTDNYHVNSGRNMQVGECSDLKFNHNLVAPESDSSDAESEDDSRQGEVSDSASAPDEQQPSKYAIIIQ